jgi:hypothetical protein
MPCSGDTFHIEMNTARSIVLIQDLQLSSKGGILEATMNKRGV